jgi:hypothetical protein
MIDSASSATTDSTAPTRTNVEPNKSRLNPASFMSWVIVAGQ